MDSFYNCQSISDKGLCKNKVSIRELFCKDHINRCILCRREDSIYKNYCWNCLRAKNFKI